MISRWHETEWRGDERIKGMITHGLPPSAGEWKCPDCGELFSAPLFRCTVTGTAFHMEGAGIASGLPASPGGMTATEVASAPSDDEVIEAMARAVCEASGRCPDDPALIYAPDYVRGVRTGRLWEEYASAARAHLAAHRAMVDACSGKVVPL